MLVLTAPDTGTVDLALAQTGDVDEHAVGDIDPARIDNVHGIASVEIHVVGVDVEEVLLGDKVSCVGICEIVFVGGVVEILAHPLQGAVCDLYIEIVIPRHDAPVPPPAEESAVGDPCLDAEHVHGREIAANQIAEDEAVLFVGDLILEVTVVIVAKFEVITCLAEVLWRLGLVSLGYGGRVGRGIAGLGRRGEGCC